MKSRKIISIALALMSVVSSVLIFICKHRMEFYGVMALLLGALGTFIVCFPYLVAEQIKNKRAGEDEITSERSVDEPKERLVLGTKIGGWALCFLSFLFLML